MTYTEAKEYMDNLNRRGIHPGLEGITALLDALSHPEDSLNVVNVVGTNGKGSTALFLAEILEAAGLKTGVFSSPAVFDEREIIRIGSNCISQKSYGELVDIISRANTMGCTRFEVETALAFLYFANKKCDVAIMEAGMGGLTDATNAAKSCIASVFTAIGIDHIDYLGDTVEKIARNKAGVIKAGSSVISTGQLPTVENVISEKAGEFDTEVVWSDYSKALNIRYKKDCTVFDYKEYKNIKTGLLGAYQVQNICLAIDAAKEIAKRLKVNITVKHIIKAVAGATEHGRFERICDKPVFYIDGAHNEPASLRLRENIETYFTNKKIIYIMGMLRDKECDKVVANTAEYADCIFTVATPNKSRTLSAFELAEIVKPYNPMVTSLDSIEEAVEMAAMMADKDTVVLAFGSLSHLNKVREAVNNIKLIKKDTHGVGKNDK